jgi:hypothetical protein
MPSRQRTPLMGSPALFGCDVDRDNRAFQVADAGSLSFRRDGDPSGRRSGSDRPAGPVRRDPDRDHDAAAHIGDIGGPAVRGDGDRGRSADLADPDRSSASVLASGQRQHHLRLHLEPAGVANPLRRASASRPRSDLVREHELQQIADRGLCADRDECQQMIITQAARHPTTPPDNQRNLGTRGGPGRWSGPDAVRYMSVHS